MNKADLLGFLLADGSDWLCLEPDRVLDYLGIEYEDGQAEEIFEQSEAFKMLAWIENHAYGLAKRIIEAGLLEYEDALRRPDRWHEPPRNRN